VSDPPRHTLEDLGRPLDSSIMRLLEVIEVDGISDNF